MKLIMIALCSALCFAGCQSRKPLITDVDDLIVFRDYRLATDDPDPQPAWSPSDHRIVVRSKQGVGILDEGSGNQRFFNTKDFSKIGWPCWIDNSRIVVGSPTFMVKNDDGELTESHIKLRLLRAKDMVLEEIGFLGDVNAYYPRKLDRDHILVQKGESIQKVNMAGKTEEYDQGFFAVAQQNGPGVALQTVPIIEKDYWTGKEGNGELVMRWREGHVSLIPDCFQAAWCRDGGVLATRLKGSLKDVKSWTQLDSDVVYIPHGSNEPIVIKKHAHSPAANPVGDICACVGRGGFLYLVNLKDGKSKELVPEGEQPQWSYDGMRLLTEVPNVDNTKNLRIWVFRHKNEVTQ